MRDELLWDHKVRFDDAIKGLKLTLEADAAKLKAMREAFGMIELKSVQVQVETNGKIAALSHAPKAAQLAQVKVRLEAEVTQECGVSLEPFTHLINADLEVDCVRAHDYVPRLATGENELRLDDLDEPDVIEDGNINIGLYIIEALGEAYDPFARAPGVTYEDPPAAAEPSPFAVLAKLKSGNDDA